MMEIFIVFFIGVAVLLLVIHFMARSRQSRLCGDSLCGSVKDPRCAGENCTWHCRLNCGARCLDLWKDHQDANSLVDQVFTKRATKEKTN